MILTAFTASLAMMTAVAGFFGMNLNRCLGSVCVRVRAACVCLVRLCVCVCSGGLRASLGPRSLGMRGPWRALRPRRRTPRPLPLNPLSTPTPRPPSYVQDEPVLFNLVTLASTLGGLALFAAFVGAMLWKGIIQL
jgi:hypothetical protein